MVVELSSRLVRRCRLLRQPLRHLDELARDLEKLGNEFIILFGRGVRVMLSLLAERFGLGDRCLQCNNLGFELPDPFGRSLGLPLSLLVQCFGFSDRSLQSDDLCFQALDWSFILGGPLRIAVCTETSLENLGE